MTATCTFDVLCTLKGFGSYSEAGDWGGYWGEQDPSSSSAAWSSTSRNS